MAIIGSFKLGANGTYSGEITTLGIYRKVRLVQTEATAKNAPDLRVFVDQAEIGVAWQKSSRSGDAYFAVKLDDPTFPAPVWANLVESQKEVAVYNLLWDRPGKGSAQGLISKRRSCSGRAPPSSTSTCPERARSLRDWRHARTPRFRPRRPRAQGPPDDLVGRPRL